MKTKNLIMDYKELFDKHIRSKDKAYRLDATMHWWEKEAIKHKICDDVMKVAINLGFNELANGTVFPEVCPCCGMERAGTSFEHYVRNKMLTLERGIRKKRYEMINSEFKAVIVGQMARISKENKKFIKENRPPLSQRSPTLRIVKKLWTGLR